MNAYDECASACSGEGGETCGQCDAGFDECAGGAQSDEDWLACEDQWNACNAECAPADTHEDCYAQYEACWANVDTEDQAAECDASLQQCLESCGD